MIVEARDGEGGVQPGSPGSPPLRVQPGRRAEIDGLGGGVMMSGRATTTGGGAMAGGRGVASSGAAIATSRGTAVTGCPEPLSCGLCLRSGIRDKWLATGAEKGRLRCPTRPESDASPFGTTGRYAQFSGGDGAYIIWAADGATAHRSFVVDGCVFKLYRDLGATSSPLGFPRGDARGVPAGVRQDFEGGFIAWDAASGRCAVQRTPAR